MERANLGRACLPLAVSIAAAFAFGCAAPDAVPGTGEVAGGGPSTGAGGPSVVVGTDIWWSRTFGAVAGGTQRARDVVFDAKTNTLVVTVDYDTSLEAVGWGASPATSAGARDVGIFKYPADGGLPLWGVSAGDAYEQFRATAAVDIAGNVIIAGGFENSIDFGSGTPTYSVPGYSDVFVAKLDAEGKQVWVKAFGDGDLQYATDVTVDEEGNVIVVGLVKGQIDFGGGALVPVSDRDMFIAKLDPGGGHIWSYRPGRAAEEDWRFPTISVASAGDGRLAVTGASEGQLVFAPQAMLPKGDGDAFVVRLEADGKGIWGESFGAAGTRQRGNAIAVGPSGEIAITGQIAGKVNFGGDEPLESGGGDDFFVAVFDAAGNHRMSRRFGGPATQSGRGVGIDGEGNVIVAGSYSGVLELFGENAFVNVEIPDGEWDGFAAKLNPQGAIQWAMNFSGPQSQYPAALAVETDGSAVLAGWYDTELKSGMQTWPSSGGADGFILSLAPKSLAP
jgi:hypothetical protein